MKKLLQISLALVTAFVAFGAQAQDVKAGEKKVAMCIGCHGIVGYQASFPEIHKVPMIAGQNAKYIVSALQAYAKGDRKHPTMRGIAGSLSEQDMNDVAAFYEQQAKLPAAPKAIDSAPPANVAELLTKGACMSCHGANLSTPIDPSYPKLAGQHGDYLSVALKSYKTEHNSNVGRSNGVMAGQVKQFSNAELKAIAAYISTLPSELATVPQSKFR
ncbi:MAG: cytochrome c4 [Burkholderiales bacterium]|nr:cytochrome c4 [Burkholderiales bacterium]